MVQGVAAWVPHHGRLSRRRARRCEGRHRHVGGMWCLLPPVLVSSGVAGTGVSGTGGDDVMSCETSPVKRTILQRDKVRFMNIYFHCPALRMCQGV